MSYSLNYLPQKAQAVFTQTSSANWQKKEKIHGRSIGVSRNELTNRNTSLFHSHYLKRKFKIFITLILLFSVAIVSGKNLKFAQYSNEQGLPYSGVSDMIEDHDGFLWIVTRLAICRFDGYRFNEYPAYSSEGEECNIIFPKFLMGDDGVLFIRSYDKKLFRYLPNECCFKEQKVENGSPFQGIIKVGFDNFIVLSNYSVFITNNNTEDLILFESKFPNLKPVFGNNKCLEIIEFNRNSFVVLLDNYKLVKIDLSNGKSDIHDVSILRNHEIISTTFDGQNRVWFNIEKSGTIGIDPLSGEILNFSINAAGGFKLLSNVVRSVVAVQENQLWMATENGLAIFNLKEQSISYVKSEFGYAEGLSNDLVMEIYLGRNNLVYVGTYYGGINVYNVNNDIFNTITPGLGKYNLSGRQLGGITEDLAGNIWIGIEGYGLNCFKRKSGEVIRFPVENKTITGFLAIRGMCFASDRKLYCTAANCGILVFDPISGEFNKCANSNKPEINSLIFNCIDRIGDELVIGTSSGIFKYSVKTKSFSPYLDEKFRNGNIETICVKGDTLWVATSSKLFGCNLHNSTIFEVEKLKDINTISFITSDSHNNIWFGDSYNGLFMYNPKTNETRHFNVLVPPILSDAKKSGRIDNFIKAAGLMSVVHKRYYLDDSYVKALETAASSLNNIPNKKFEAQKNTIIA